MPIIARIVGAPDFSNAYIPLQDNIPLGLPLVQAKALGPVFAYGNFITVAINFLLLAFAVFMMVKGINRLRSQAPPPEVEDKISSTDKLLAEIRDTLQQRGQL